MVASLVTLFKKLKFLTDENVGWGPIDLPELELQTTAYWLTVEGSRGRWRSDELDVALLGVGRAIQTVASILLMVDPRDLGLVTQVRSPHAEEPTIYLYEAVPGGIGLSERLWERHDELVTAAADLVAACGCEAGCPSCTGPRSGARRRRPGVGAASSPRAQPDGAAPDPGRLTRMAVASTALDRRLARYRAATRGTAVAQAAVRASPGAIELASRLAEALDAEVVRTPEGVVVRAEPASRQLAVDRERLAALPGQPPPDVPLVCLDTETTGLATAAGTVAFLIGLGWWERDRFRQVQLLLPEHAEERALLTALAAAIPADAWLVTYNGRGFDWPLLVARYRLAGRSAPPHAGHLDLLPVVRRLFRHRMANARLRTAEAELLGLHRSRGRRRRRDPGALLRLPPRRSGRKPRGRRPAQRSGRQIARPPARPPRDGAR